jgi:hypothetical protein
MSKLLFGAALQGLGAGAAQFGQASLQMEMNRQRQEEEERRQIAVMQERERLMAERGGGGGGASSGGGRGGNVFDLARAEEQYQFAATPVTDAEAVRASGGAIPALKAFGATPEDEPQVVGAVPGFESLVERKRAELQSLREAIALGGDVEKLSKARQNDQKRGQLDRFEDGEARAGEAAMVGDGKAVYGGDSNVTRNTVTGRTAVTPVGQAEIGRRAAAADLSGARAGAVGTGATDGPKPVTGVDLERAARAAERALAVELGVPASRLQEEISRLQRRGSLTAEQTAMVAEYRAALGRLQELGARPGASPAAATPRLPTLPPGARQIGTSGGKPVFETPDGKRFIQG